MPPWVLHTIKQHLASVLECPVCLFAGIREPDPGDDREGFGYGSPMMNKIDGNGRSTPNPRKQLLFFYLNADFYLYEVRWEEPDPIDPSKPIGWKTRYGRAIK